MDRSFLNGGGVQVSEVSSDRISGEIRTEGRVKPGDVRGRKQEIVLADLNTDFRIVAQQLSALLQSGGYIPLSEDSLGLSTAECLKSEITSVRTWAKA